jgi:PAS domain-containing protein
MSIENLGELGGILATLLTVLGLLARYVFIPLKRFTKRLRTNSKEILDALPVLFDLAHHWPLQPEAGSLINSVDKIESDIGEIRQILYRFLKDYPCGIFICDLEGRNKEVNRTYARWLEVGENELLDHKWKGFLVGSSKKDEYEDEWKMAFHQGRELEFPIEMRTSKFENKEFKIRAYPIFDENNEVKEYFGILLEKK